MHVSRHEHQFCPSGCASIHFNIMKVHLDNMRNTAHFVSSKVATSFPFWLDARSLASSKGTSLYIIIVTFARLPGPSIAPCAECPDIILHSDGKFFECIFQYRALEIRLFCRGS